MKYIFLIFIALLYGCKNENDNIVVSQASAPSAPLSLSVTPSDRIADLNWLEPKNNGGSEIFEYSIYRGLSNTNLSILTIIGPSSTTYRDSNLVNETRYYYAVAARNSYGEGSRSNIASAVPFSEFANILEVDSLGNILGGDSTDWCLQTFLEKLEVSNSNILSYLTDNSIELASFTASTLGNMITLYWTTATETNSARFVIEISSGGPTYEPIGSVTGSGTTTEPRSYQFNINYNQTGGYTFRLKAVDFAGNFEYFNLSNSVYIGIPSRFSFGPVYRNPIVSISKLNIGLPQDDIVSVFFINGSDTNFVLRNQFIPAGYKNIYVDKHLLGYNNEFKRVYIKCSTYNSQNDCKSYGDVQFK